MIQRHTDIKHVRQFLEIFPAVAILGPRQSGKSTLARQFQSDYHFDLEDPEDVERLAEPKSALGELRGLITIDEIQRAPDLFPLLRFLIDSRPSQRYLLLGSASRDLIRQSSETLAGRIGYHELSGFRLEDVGPENKRMLWLRGGMPRSYTAVTDEASFIWRQQYITTFLERDIPQLGIAIPAPALRRFWTMLCHYHGQLLNYAEFSRSFGVSESTVRRYIDVLEGTFMVRVLQPWHVNTGKRLVKRPKVYFRDTGLLHALLSIRDERDLASHNKLGASWEGFALEVAARAIGKRNEELSFWATHTGAEVDLVWQEHGKNWAIEVKYADAPRKTRSMASALEDLELDHLWVLYPGDKSYRIAENVTVRPLVSVGSAWEYV